MTAYSYKSHVLRERNAGDRTPLITIDHSNPLNNEHRAPFMSGLTAARALMVHAQRELSDPVRGPQYFNHLRKAYDSATISSQRVKERLRQRQARAANALSNSDVELTAEQLQIVADIAMVQAEIGEKLLNSVVTAGFAADTVIDAIDRHTRDALLAAHTVRTASPGIDVEDLKVWKQNIREEFEKTEGYESSDGEALIARFDGLITNLEAALPLAVDREEPLYEVDDALDPLVVAMTVDQLRTSMGTNPNDSNQMEELSVMAKQAVYESMSMDEREFAATKITLTTDQRLDIGMQIVNSTPPVIRIPEADLGQGRYDVRMNSEEEARVMDHLIRFAGEARVYPGPEQASQRVENMKELAMPAALQGRFTVGYAVANNEASIAQAAEMIKSLSMYPETRLLIHADNPKVAEELMQIRTEAQKAVGHETFFKDSADATRHFGGWTLNDLGEDRILGSNENDAAIFVANSDSIWAFNNSSDLEIGSIQQAVEQHAQLTSQLASIETKLKNAKIQMEASRDPKFVENAKAISRAGFDATRANEAAYKSANSKLRNEYEHLVAEQKAALANTTAAERRLSKMERQREQDTYRVSTPGDLARATVVDLAAQQGKLVKAYIPGQSKEGAAIQTSKGPLTEERPYIAQQRAQRLRNGDSVERGNLRRLFHPTRGVNATLIDGSNYFKEDKGAAKGFAVLRDRMAAVPKSGTILTCQTNINPKTNEPYNSISHEVVSKLNREVIHATAWRITENTRPLDADGRRVTLSERKTELDLGFIGYKGRAMLPQRDDAGMIVRDKDGKVQMASVAGEFARPREWSFSDLKGKVVEVRGGGSMTRETYDAIRQAAHDRGMKGDSLSTEQVNELHSSLVADGHTHLEAPKIAQSQLSRAIMQEAVVDYATQVFLASNMGKDYHSATLVRLSVDAEKLLGVVDQQGDAIPISEAYDHNKQYALTIADNSRNDLAEKFKTVASTDNGQLVLASIPGISAKAAAQIGEHYNTLGDVIIAAEKQEASPALPRALHHELSRPNTWAKAFDHAADIISETHASGMDGLSAQHGDYPERLKTAGRAEMLYTKGDVDLHTPTMALVIGGNSKPLEADINAVKQIATDAKAKDWAVSIHLSGETSASIAKVVAEMPEETRPRILLVGDGHPSMGSYKAREAIEAVQNAGGGYITSTPPVTEHKNGPDAPATYKTDRRSALDLQAHQASGLIVVKSSGNDVELLALRAAMEAERPIAAVGASNLESPTIDDLRFRSAGYSANQRLLAGGDSVSVMLENRHLAFQPNFIPDMTAQAEQRYITFEGSTAGMMNAPDNNRDDKQVDHSALESGQRMSTKIVWKDSAEYIADGHGTGGFIDKIVTGEAKKILASEADKAAMARQNDYKFLDVSTRLNTRADVAEIFNEVNDRAQADIDADMQRHYMAQRASSMGR